MKQIDLKAISAKDVRNPVLGKLIAELQAGINAGIDPVRLTPESAQLTQGYTAGPGHTDHTDYQEHTDTKPSHGDYCD